MHTTLYRKWRPSDFSSVVGQNHITDILRYEISSGKTPHAYLFCGSRGTGKTTCAKILAKAINCASPIDGNPCCKCEACLSVENGTATDVIEMDAASNNGVDYIRDIRDEVVYAPAFLKNKVYIIDEVHMLSQSAFNALLKTLEEPPAHVVFILATTELQKLPATITSRCQRFDFRRISSDDIADRLEFIAGKENISVTHEAAKLIGRLSLGGMRDSISLLELCSGTGKTIDVELVNSTAGVTGRTTVSNIIKSILKRDYSSIFDTLSELYSSSIDLVVFWQELISYYRDMLVIKTASSPEKYLDLTNDELTVTLDIASRFTKERLLYHIRALEDSYALMQRGGPDKRVIAETTLVKLCDDKLSDSTSSLLARIAALEDAIASGVRIQTEINREIPSASSDDESDKDVPALERQMDNSISQNIANDTQISEKLTPVDSWIEIINKVDRNNKGVGSILKLASAFTCDNKLIIKVADGFSKMLLSNEDTLKLIASSAVACGILPSMSTGNILITIEKNIISDNDPLSELNDI